LLKDNGIGRPSTRANIIETLFRRKYIERKRKNLIATPTGVHLIETISNELLKSPELTGDWEKKLRLIEKGEYDAENFKKELIEMVVELTNEVLFEKPKEEKAQLLNTNLHNVEQKENDSLSIAVGDKCPKCGNGKIIKGKTALGCSSYKEGCDFIFKY
ncbi:MAG: DNA topoisomerase, partial [Crocinitomicaceae bacterium]